MLLPLIVGAAIVGWALLSRDLSSAQPAVDEVEVIDGIAYATEPFQRRVRSRLEGRRVSRLPSSDQWSEFVSLGTEGEELAPAWWDRRASAGRTMIVSLNRADKDGALGAVSPASAAVLCQALLGAPQWAIVRMGAGSAGVEPESIDTGTAQAPALPSLGELLEAAQEAGQVEELARELERAGYPEEAELVRSQL